MRLAIPLLLLVACNSTPTAADAATSSCPAAIPNGACSGTAACFYNFQETYCVDGQWLHCGDAVGTGCNEPAPAEGSVCCPNDYTRGLFGQFCACFDGHICRCDDFHLHCEACDGGA